MSQGFEQQPKVQQETLVSKIENHIQIELMIGYIGKTTDWDEVEVLTQAGVTDEDFFEWTDKYSEKIRALFKEEPSIYELYQNDPISCLQYIKNKLKIVPIVHH